MATSNHLYEFEGDPTQQPFPSLTYRYPPIITTSRWRPAYARVLFERGDLDDYFLWVKLRNEAITANQMILSEFGIDGAGGRIGGGFWFSVVPIAGARLIETITVNSVEISIDTVPVYAGVLDLKFNLYKDGELHKTVTVLSEYPFRTGATGRSNHWQAELVGNVERVRRLDIASSVEEIKRSDRDSVSVDKIMAAMGPDE